MSPSSSSRTSILPSITCFRKQFLHKMSAIQLALLRFILCRMLPSSLTLCIISLFLFTRSVKLDIVKVTINRLHPTARQFRPVGHEIVCRAKTSLRLNGHDLAVKSIMLKKKRRSISHITYVGKSVSELQTQVATYVSELSAGNCHR